MSAYFRQNYLLKDKWSDAKRTKNHPKTCQKTHSFCNFDYEWAEQKKSNKISATPINQSIPNIILPKQKERAITVNYDGTTEQDLDDWVAQSMNRNLGSILNPQKTFYIPSELEDDLKHRYKNKSAIIKGQEDTYFSTKLMTSKKKYYAVNKNKLDISEMFIDYKQLQTKHIPGTPIKIRQNKNKKLEIRRRNAVFLDRDIHYNRLIKDISKSKQKTIKKQISPFLTQTQTMFYSYNLQSLKRKICKQETPSSITQNQYKRLKEPPKDFLNRNNQDVTKQEAIHEKFRQNINENTKDAEKRIIERQQALNSKIKNFEIQKTNQKPCAQNQAAKNKFKSRSISNKNANFSISKLDAKSIGKDKVLQKKVLNLLNDMQILSEQIDYQMSELNIHASQVMLKSVDIRPQTKWVQKAQQKLIQKQIQLSIDCYKQALIIQPEFFVPIFNIAVLLQKQKMYFQSKRWFQICKQFQIDEENVKFGLAIVNLKQMKFQESFTIIQQLIKKQQGLKKQQKLVYYYIRSLCCKKLRKFDIAKTDYNILLKNCRSSNYNFLSNFFFSLMYAKSRRLSVKFDCLSYLNFRQTLLLINFTQQTRIRQDNQPLRNLAKKLVDSVLFKRFSISLLEKMLQKGTYQLIKSDNLIFINDQQTALVLSGMVVVRNHLKQFDHPQTISVLQQGGIIGCGKIDNFLNQKSNNWFIAKSDVQIVKINRKSFNQFWKGQITFQFDFKYNFLKNVSLFKNLSESTLFSICQKIQRTEYSFGTILFNDCSYRNQVINHKGIGFGLGKSNPTTDSRFVNMKKMNSQRHKGKYRMAQLIKKHYFALNDMKFRRLKYPGLFILMKGRIEVQDDRGFRCSDLINQRQYFGQNLFINSDGFQNYGRMVVASPNAQLYHLSVEKMMWIFSSDDKKIMMQNSKNRQAIQTVNFLRCRFRQCQNTRINYKFLLNNDRD